MRRRRIGKAARLGDNACEQARPDPQTDLMTPAILFAFASAACLGAGVVTAQFGLRSVEPLSGAAISVPAFTLLFLLLSPLLLAGEPVVWRGVPIFAAIGLVFPALLTLLTFASNRALGPSSPRRSAISRRCSRWRWRSSCCRSRCGACSSPGS